jgi:hypothetical protein
MMQYQGSKTKNSVAEILLGVDYVGVGIIQSRVMFPPSGF